MADTAAPTTEHDDRVRPLTRGVALAIIPFLVVAFAVLYPWPTDTGRLFAWMIKPTITPMVLGALLVAMATPYLWMESRLPAPTLQR